MDIGNTTLKATLWDGNEVVDAVSLPTDEQATVVDVLATWSKKEGRSHEIWALSSGTVTGTWAEDWNVQFLSKDMPMPLKHKYQSFESLGMDRWVMANAAALDHGPNFLLVTVGTCITYNVVNEGVYLGGAISPGAQMRLDAMHSGTHALPQLTLDLKGAEVLAGADTQRSMQVGALQGLHHEIESLISAYLAQYELPLALIVGTHAKTLLAGLKKHIFAPNNYELEALKKVVEYVKANIS